MQVGRPDVDVLVRAGPAPLQSREGIQAHLVVVACGPTTLVEAAKNTVMTVEEAADPIHVNVQFSPVNQLTTG